MSRPPVIVTRPGGAGLELERRVRTAGWNALWLPAFDLGDAPDVEAVRRTLANLDSYELAVFVSAHAVAATARWLDGAWPRGTMIGAVGAATERAAIAELPGASEAVRIVPSDDVETGSEGFWAAWQVSGRRASRVVVVRAQGGRDWLIDTFRGSGATVDVLAAYTRAVHHLSDEERARLHALMLDGAPPITVFTSTEAIGSLETQLAASIDSAVAWLRAGTALATHRRIADQLRDAGYARVVTVDADDSSLLAKLESLQFSS